ncbi:MULTISPECIES: carbohydrate porin [Vibrio]|uniref:carbohydrate porin n=1 Tax=Vibrio TaxID=662 RepID=UPI000243BFD1|nr:MULTISPECIES: carbohydrate porin [Vibrio]AEX22318.1 maltoporin [Vibrio sp. EJY3]BDR13351.1 outer membrane protein S [Vibrio sp. STUT-A11]
MKHKILKYSAVCSSLLVALSAHANTPEGLAFHGYLMYGAGFTNDEVLNEAAYDWAGTGGNIFRLPGQYHADSSAGRLGNDGNWLQLQSDYGLNMNDMNWGVHVMFSSNGYSDNFVPEWIYVDAAGVFPAMPDATVWAGQKYVNRVSTPLVVNEALASDGRGFGIEKIDLDFAALDLSVTRNLYNSYTNGDMNQGDTVLFSSALRGMDITDTINSELYLNYGTYIGPNSDVINESTGDKYKEAAPDSYQVGLKFNHNLDNLHHQLFLRYSSEARQVATREWWQPVPSDLIGGFFYGKYQLTDRFRFEYTYAHETEKYDQRARETGHPNRMPIAAMQSDWDSFIIRNTYNWNKRTSTQLEAGYEQIKYEAVNPSEDGTNSGYKITLAQNLHIGNGEWDRPVLNFYVTYAEQDVETDVFDTWAIGGFKMGKSDALTAGVMFEAWW